MRLLQQSVALAENHLREFRRSTQRKAAQRVLQRFPAPYQLHIGCGRVCFDGWVNIDLDPQSSTPDLFWDVSRDLPCEDESCRLIHSEHFLEHLSAEQGLVFLKECQRVLKRGGVVRIAMPSLEEIVREYVAGDWKQQPWFQKYGCEWIKTGAERLNLAFRHWGHQWLYDREELHRRMQEAGFSDLRDVAWGESQVPELCGRETRPESRLICEAWK